MEKKKINVKIHPDLLKAWSVPTSMRVLVCDHTFDINDWNKIGIGGDMVLRGGPDCWNTRFLKPITIDEVELELMDGCYYSPTPEYHGFFKILKKDNIELLGETLYFRTPFSCLLPKGCCGTCYGEHSPKPGNIIPEFKYENPVLIIAKDIEERFYNRKYTGEYVFKLLTMDKPIGCFFCIVNNPDDIDSISDFLNVRKYGSDIPSDIYARPQLKYVIKCYSTDCEVSVEDNLLCLKRIESENDL